MSDKDFSNIEHNDDNQEENLTLSLPPSNPEHSDVPDLLPYSDSYPIPVSAAKHRDRPTAIEVFTGQAVGVVRQLFDARESTDQIITSLREARKSASNELNNLKTQQRKDLVELKHYFDDATLAKFGIELNNVHKRASALITSDIEERIENLEQIRTSIDTALLEYQWTPGQLWLYQWSLVFLLVITGIIEGIFVYLYIQWHGVYISSFFDIYKPESIGLLSQINFVGGPTTLSIAAEVLVWSSLGVWAQQAYINSIKMLRRQFRFADDGPKYMGIMMRNTSVAAIIVILLKLAKFSLFGVSLEAGNPLAFDFTIGISFLLGFFGDDSAKILSGFRDRIVKGTSHKDEA